MPGAELQANTQPRSVSPRGTGDSCGRLRRHHCCCQDGCPREGTERLTSWLLPLPFWVLTAPREPLGKAEHLRVLPSKPGPQAAAAPTPRTRCQLCQSPAGAGPRVVLRSRDVTAEVPAGSQRGEQDAPVPGKAAELGGVSPGSVRGRVEPGVTMNWPACPPPPTPPCPRRPRNQVLHAKLL